MYYQNRLIEFLTVMKTRQIRRDRGVEDLQVLLIVTSLFRVSWEAFFVEESRAFLTKLNISNLVSFIETVWPFYMS